MGGKKAEPRGVVHVIDHSSGTGLAYVFGRRQDAVFVRLKALESRVASGAFTPMAGGPRSGRLPQSSLTLGRNQRRPSREETYQAADTPQASRPSHHWLLENDHDARSDHWPLQQSL